MRTPILLLPALLCCSFMPARTVRIKTKTTQHTTRYTVRLPRGCRVERTRDGGMCDLLCRYPDSSIVYLSNFGGYNDANIRSLGDSIYGYRILSYGFIRKANHAAGYEKYPDIPRLVLSGSDSARCWKDIRIEDRATIGYRHVPNSRQGAFDTALGSLTIKLRPRKPKP